MQDINELQKNNLELLNLQIAKIEAERDRIHDEMQSIRLLLTQRASKGQWHRAAAATVSVLAVISLSFIFVYHNALSSVNINNQPEESAISVLEPGRIMRGEHQSAQSGKQTTRFNSKKAASQLQWGPLLVMPDSATSKRHYGFDPVVKAQQEDLLTLGFDVGKADGFKGAHTQQAITEFRALYLPDSARQLQDADLAAIMSNYANLARSDAARFGIDQGVVAAIRLSSVRTGVDFAYLMKLAATESNFEPASEAATSSATGLYQFTHDTWLNALKMYGAKYGLVADYAANIEYSKTRSGDQRPFVRDKALYEHLLALRKNPRISAMMAAETVHDNQQKLAHLFNRAPTETDLYLTHFLGADEAITFLRSLEQSPETHAMELFPEAASSNRNIFHPKTSKPRTMDEVYAFFGEKFTTSRYDDLGAN
jgi:peptidoglycan hydrolase-like protein with peptidoglycan-binding domain